MSRRVPPRAAVPVLLWLAALAAAPARALPPSVPAASGGLRFLQPGEGPLRGLVDLEVAAPATTTAVRFSVDGIWLAELTDLYARRTGLAPVWRTATDAGWLPPGRHLLRAEADTPSGPVAAQREVVTLAPAPAPGQVPLTGGWRFAAEAELPAGALEGERPPATQPAFDDSAWPMVMVPGSLGAIASRWNTHDGLLGVYRRRVRLDGPAGEAGGDSRGERTAIVLRSCYWACRVFVNGVEVGATRGGYLPARFDITGAVRPGENLVAVLVDHRRTTMGPLARVHGFYWNWGGLLQEVYLERTPAVALVGLRAEGARDGTLTLRPLGVNATDTAQPVDLVVRVYGPDGRLVLGPHGSRTTLPAGGGEADPIVLHVASPALWDPEHPHLYTVEAAGPGRTVTERTGFRDVSASGGDVLLNGRVVEGLQGVNRHADYPGLGRTQPDGLAYRELRQLREKGFRLLRPAHYPTTPALLDAADELGMLVIEEINVTGLPGAALARPEVRAFAADQLARMIRRDRSHPSVIAWSVGNENFTEEDGAAEYVRDTIALGRRLDPTRLYTQVTYEGARDRTHPYQDLIAQNAYPGWYAGQPRAVVPLLDAVQARAGGKPIVLSEYGAEAVPGRPGSGKGSEFYQGYLVDEYNRLLAGRPHFLGKMYWLATDFWARPDWEGGNPAAVPPFNVKGLRSLFREPKLAWRVVFAPLRLAASVVEAPPERPSVLTERIVVREVRGREAGATVLVTPPAGFTAEPAARPVHVGPYGEAAVDVRLRGKLPAGAGEATGLIRAVVDPDTEAQPLPLAVRRADTVIHPSGDGFDRPTLAPGWTVVRPEPAGWSLTERPGALRLSARPGGENLFLRDGTPGGDFTAEADVEAGDRSGDGRIALYGYRDDADYVRLALGRAGGRWAVEFLTAADGRVVARDLLPVGAGRAWLRLVRRGTDVYAEYSTDGATWFRAGSATLAGRVRIGLQALDSRPAPPAAPAYVHELRVLVPG